MTTSSVDPTVEMAAIKARLDALATGTNEAPIGLCYIGIEEDTTLPLDQWSRKYPYRDFEPGSVIPAAGGRLMAANEQQQPHNWAFQIHHFAPTRAGAIALSIETDKSLIGWAPSDNADPITTFFFNVYDETAKNGSRLGWIATRFYETQLGQSPDMTLEITP